ERERKSVGAETTFARDLPDGPELRAALNRIAAEVADRLDRAHVKAQTVALKLRYANFHTITRQASVKSPVSDVGEIQRIAAGLLDAVTESGDQFRLLGIQGFRLVEHAPQSALWDDAVAARPGDDADQSAVDAPQ